MRVARVRSCSLHRCSAHTERLFIIKRGYARVSQGTDGELATLRTGDFFGELSSELKSRGMEVFVYMPIAYNHYFAAAHPDAGWLYRNKTSGRIPRPLNISCLNYPGYIQLVANYTRQVIQQYAPAAVRYDGWQMTIDTSAIACASPTKRSVHPR